MRSHRFHILASLLALAFIAQGDPPGPSWWHDGDPPVVAPGANSNNLGPANIGQAKHMAKSALDAIRLERPQIATQIEADLVGAGKPIPNWDAPLDPASRQKNHAPLLIGQLKAIAHPFYNHLNGTAPAWVLEQIQHNHAGSAIAGTHYWQVTGNPNYTEGGYFPWNPATPPETNRSVATVGQLKAIFALDFAALTSSPGTDTDADGLDDNVELALGTDPNDSDTDGDGTSDGVEVGAGKNPSSNTSFPPHWRYVEKTLSYGYGKPSGSTDVHSHLVTERGWDPPATNASDLGGELFWTDLDDRLKGVFPFPLNPPESSKTGLVPVVSSGQVDLQGEPPKHATLRHRRYWLVFDESLVDGYKSTGLILTKRSINHTEDQQDSESVDIIVPPGMSISEPMDLEIGLITNPPWDSATAHEGVEQFLLPVDISVTKEGDAAAPEDGLVVKKTDTVRYRLSPGLPDAPLLLEDKIQWHWRILKWDGTYSGWTAYEDGQGHTFTARPQDAGIYEVKASMDGQDFFLKRAKDDPHSAKEKDENECFGVVEQDWQINARNQAKANLGSVAYAFAVANDNVGKNEYKCNLFVGHKATDGGAIVPKINGRDPRSKYYPIANQWAGTQVANIPGWILLPVNTYPQPGYVVARGAHIGHTGIVDYDGAWIGAGTFNVNRKADLRNDISLRSGTSTYQPARFHKYTP